MNIAKPMRHRLFSLAIAIILAVGLAATPLSPATSAAAGTTANMSQSEVNPETSAGDAAIPSTGDDTADSGPNLPLSIDSTVNKGATIASADEPTTEVNIYLFNDFHGQVEVYDTSGNLQNSSARFAAVAKKLMADNPNSFIVAGGDNYQGSMLSGFFYGAPVSEMMKTLGVEYSALGNHDYDWGPAFIRNYFIPDSNVTFLSSNIFLKGTNERPDYVRPYAIKEIGGKKIGLVGYTLTGTPSIVKAEYVSEVEFRAPGQWLRDIVTDLRENKGCDAVIAITHDTTNLSSYGFDGQTNGHTHSASVSNTGGYAQVQAGSNGNYIGRLRLVFDNEAGTLAVTASNTAANAVRHNNSTILPVNVVDQDLKEIIDEYKEIIEPWAKKVVGFSDTTITSSTYKPYYTKLVYDHIKRLTGTAYVTMQNSGGLRSVPYYHTQGQAVTYEYVNIVMPFDNETVLMDLSGANLISALRNSSTVQYGATGSGTSWTLLDGTPILNTSTSSYKVSVNDFMFTNGDSIQNFINTCTWSDLLGKNLRDIMADELGWRSAITVTLDPAYPGAEPTVYTQPYNQKINKPADPVRAGSKFKGWYADGEAYDFDDIMLWVVEDITLTAQWDTVSASVTTAGVSDIKELVEFVFSLRGLDHVNTVAFEFTLAGGNLRHEKLETMNSFEAMPIRWTESEDGQWNGSLTLACLGNTITSDDALDVMKLFFNAIALGDATITINSATVTMQPEAGGEIITANAAIDKGTATTSIIKVYSIYDITRDGVIGQADFAIVALACGITEESPRWSQTIATVNGRVITPAMCDMNIDGEVDMLDLMAVFLNYAEAY
jgi:2',3'-cyclic-nucleotide 2'-phosphodiesterase (5'-nucleotidase family)